MPLNRGSRLKEQERHLCFFSGWIISIEGCSFSKQLLCIDEGVFGLVSDSGGDCPQCIFLNGFGLQSEAGYAVSVVPYAQRLQGRLRLGPKNVLCSNYIFFSGHANTNQI